ncbi:hypothetical protein VNI00_018652 [Paramarasmius palmivorus]|uniref:Uncharacterized protein n=1 Tax=Paramarasmius palmivorus TaxID=297713 RepID=A0AAW0AWY5_9AGAR
MAEAENFFSSDHFSGVQEKKLNTREPAMGDTDDDGNNNIANEVAAGSKGKAKEVGSSQTSVERIPAHNHAYCVEETPYDVEIHNTEQRITQARPFSHAVYPLVSSAGIEPNPPAYSPQHHSHSADPQTRRSTEYEDDYIGKGHGDRNSEDEDYPVRPSSVKLGETETSSPSPSYMLTGQSSPADVDPDPPVYLQRLRSSTSAPQLRTTTEVVPKPLWKSEDELDVVVLRDDSGASSIDNGHGSTLGRLHESSEHPSEDNSDPLPLEMTNEIQGAEVDASEDTQAVQAPQPLYSANYTTEVPTTSAVSTQTPLMIPTPSQTPYSDTSSPPDPSYDHGFYTTNHGNANTVYNGSNLLNEYNRGNMSQNVHMTLQPPPVHIGPFYGFRIPADRGSRGQHYTRLMLNAGEGYPLWCPQPEERDPPLPEAYKKSGIRIGDIGIIHQDKPFDFLFNITVPKGDPINELVPMDFAPISMHGLGLQFRNGSRQGNDHIGGPTHCWDRRSFRDDNLDYTGYTFSHSQIEAALLMLPKGSSTRELKTTKPFLRFAVKNGKAWIEHANRDQHRNTSALHLITSREQCSAWGMASHVRRQHENSDSVVLPFAVHPDATYEWGHHKGCESKAFPRPGHGNPEEVMMNQTVFVRGYRISVINHKNIWGIKRRVVDVQYGPDDDGGQWGPGGRVSGGSGFSTRSSNSGTAENHGNGGQSTTGGYSRSQPLTGGRAIFGKLTHPCDIVNALLHAIAKKSLDGEVWDGIAISHDNDWISTVQELDAPLSPYNVQEFLREVIKNIPYTIDREHNTIYTESSDESISPKDTNLLDDIVDEVTKEVIGRYSTWFSEENDQDMLILDAPAELAHVPVNEVVNV